MGKVVEDLVAAAQAEREESRGVSYETIAEIEEPIQSTAPMDSKPSCPEGEA